MTPLIGVERANREGYWTERRARTIVRETCVQESMADLLDCSIAVVDGLVARDNSCSDARAKSEEYRLCSVHAFASQYFFH